MGKLSKGEDRGSLKLLLREFLCCVYLLVELARNEGFVGQQSPKKLRTELTCCVVGPFARS